MHPHLHPADMPPEDRRRADLERRARNNRIWRQRERERKERLQRENEKLAAQLRHAQTAPVGLPASLIDSREDWLQAAIELFRPEFSGRGLEIPEATRAALGWPPRKSWGGVCFSPSCSARGVTEIFISPVLDDGLHVLSVLCHELCHAAVGVEHQHDKEFSRAASTMELTGRATGANGLDSPAWLRMAQPMLTKLGAFPHAELTPAEKKKKQATRMIKKCCNICGLNVRIAKTYIERIVANSGDMRCPDPGCAGHLL